MKWIWLTITLHFTVPAFSTVDTIHVFSKSMNKKVKCVVITPANYKKVKQNFPVVYLLHGFAGDYSNWIKKVPSIDSLANVYQMLIVSPDAAWSSWYFDSPVDSSFRYETFTSTELPVFIDANYRTIISKKGRAIAGLSMGGHGALFLAFRHPETFGACGSMSGVLNISLLKTSFDLYKRLGDTVLNRKYYSDWSVIKTIENYNPKDSLSVIIDCGLQDFVYFMNKAAHEKMLKIHIPHTYIERPGSHSWSYWGNAVQYQLLFFRDYFQKNK
jgi:S-formylglutathione hydrolase FrmB